MESFESSIFFIAITCILLFVYTTRNFNYWKNRNTPFAKPTPLFGNFYKVITLSASVGDKIFELYNTFTSDYVGFFIFDKPCLLIRNPALIKNVLIRDFEYFQDRNLADNKHDEISSNIMFIVKSPAWKAVRGKVSPTFTTGKMKRMLPLIVEASTELKNYIANVGVLSEATEAREMCLKFTTDVISSCAFGINAHSFKYRDAPFRIAARRMFDWNIGRSISMTSYFTAHFLVKTFRLSFVEKVAGRFMRRVFWKHMREREETNSKRGDLIDLLIQLKNSEGCSDLGEDLLLAQAVQFFFAGFETSGTTLTFALYCLAKNQSVQQELRSEIKTVLGRYGEITYEALSAMPYLEAVINETLRFYPILPFLDRRCSKTYKIPGTDLEIQKGVPIYISVMGLHYNPEYFDEPLKFNPERFTTDQIQSATFLPFGDGPRNCLGTMYSLEISLLTLLVLCLLLYIYLTRNFNHWTNLNVPFVKPLPLFGNFYKLCVLRSSIGEIIYELYNSVSSDYVGFFVLDQPCLLIRDLQLAKQMFTRDFEYFPDRNVFEGKHDEISANIMFIKKFPEWRNIRNRISPIFTSGKMKRMLPLIVEASEELKSYIANTAVKSESTEVRDMCLDFTTDAISTCAFGINAHSFTNQNSAFRAAAGRMFDWTNLGRSIAMTSYFVSPFMVKMFRLHFVERVAANFLHDVFWKHMNEREESKTARGDLIDLLIELRKTSNSTNLDEKTLLAQAVQFFFAGFETTGTTLTFLLYRLAKHVDVQDKLRVEVRSMLKKYRSINYDALLSEMPYLDAVVNETLRIYPILSFLDRRCCKPYKIPGTDIVLEKGVSIYISLFGFHYNPEIFEDPLKFNPDRFINEKSQLSNVMTFGEGPRNCIGIRFAMMTLKVATIQILADFEIESCDTTPDPLLFDPKGFLLSPKNGKLNLRFRKLTTTAVCG